NSTPTFFVNGRKVTLNRPEDLEDAVARALR
ncbi:MAG: disulfide bond formation protein DsbA, partial [Proteobacteria bacterium]|nr:disulfide bond formation protein DsbA [Pseudomonadota bacterium]